MHLTAFLKPLRDDVLLGEVLGRSINHHLRMSQSVSLPGKAAVDHPPQDARPFFSELFRQIPIRTFRLVQKRNHMEASPCSVVHIAKRRLVIAADRQLEGWREG